MSRFPNTFASHSTRSVFPARSRCSPSDRYAGPQVGVYGRSHYWSRMRVLLATDTFYPTISGVSVFTACLAQSLSRYGDVVAIVAPSPPRALSSDKYETHRTVWVPSIPVWIHPHLR